MFRDVEERSSGQDKKAKAIYKQNKNQTTRYGYGNADMKFPRAKTRARINANKPIHGHRELSSVEDKV